ncbi:unnamed protein product [Prunus armeniaca]
MAIYAKPPTGAWFEKAAAFILQQQDSMVSENNFVQPAIPRFDETQRKTLEEQRLKDLKTKNYLFQAIDRVILETILKKDTAKDIWDSMKTKYQGTARVKRAQLQALRKEFEIFHMKEGESVNDYFARTLVIANKMRIHGEKMEDVAVIEKILRSMTRKFDYVVCSIEESNDIDSLSIDVLKSSLLVHEQRMTSHVVEEQALKITTHEGTFPGRGRGRGGFRGRGIGRGHQLSYNQGAQFDKASVECFHCQKFGHYQYECPDKEKETKVNLAETEEEILLMAYIDKKKNPSGDTWYLDSGCSNHMCGNKLLFSDLDENFRENVKLGNNSSICVMEKGFAILIQKDNCQIHHPEKGLFAQAQMTTNRMFPLYTQIPHDDQTCFTSTTQDTTWMWHYRYGHLNFNGLKTLEQKKMVSGLPQIQTPSKVCEDCIIGKQHRDSFPKRSTWGATEVLQLVHSDICGPINPTSNSNKRFRAHVEKETGNCIKIIRTDRGGEFTSHEFTNLCEMNGIRRQLTAAYSPQQNGVAERINRTIMNMVRSMLTKKDIPKKFWPEVINWSVHILNRSPTLAVKNMTPKEAWTGCKPAVDHFRIFGCLAYAHVSDQKRGKLDDKSVKCVLLGVSEVSKAYRLYNPVTQKIIISRDVVFDEGSSWNWSNTVSESIPFDLDINDERRTDAQILEDILPNVPASENITKHEAQTYRDTMSNVSANEPSEGQPSNSDTQWIRKRPVWMIDYVSGDELSDDDNVAHHALFADSDPVLFEDALNEKGEVDKYKARLVAKGYKQEYDVDYAEVFAPVARLDTIRLVVSLAAQNYWPVYQLDVKSAFLHGELNEKVFIDQPLGYVQKGNEKKVFRL